MVITYSRTKIEGEWSFGSEDKSENRWTDVIALPAALMQSAKAGSFYQSNCFTKYIRLLQLAQDICYTATGTAVVGTQGDRETDALCLLQ